MTVWAGSGWAGRTGGNATNRGCIHSTKLAADPPNRGELRTEPNGCDGGREPQGDQPKTGGATSQGSDGRIWAIFMKPPEGISGRSEGLMVSRWPSTSCSRPILNDSLGDIFRELQHRSPGRSQPLHIRTLQRGMRKIRAYLLETQEEQWQADVI